MIYRNKEDILCDDIDKIREQYRQRFKGKK